MPTLSRRVITMQCALAAMAGGLLWPADAVAQAPLAASPANVLSLGATATRELTMDWLTVTFGTTREGPEPAALQSQLRQALDAALSEARRLARPDEVLVQLR